MLSSRLKSKHCRAAGQTVHLVFPNCTHTHIYVHARWPMSPRAEHFLVCSRSPPHFRAQLFVCREDCLQVLEGPLALPSRCRSINTFEVGDRGGVEKTKVQTHAHGGWICMKTSSSLSQSPTSLTGKLPRPARSLYVPLRPPTPTTTTPVSASTTTQQQQPLDLHTVANARNTEQLLEFCHTSALQLNYTY